MGWIGGGENPSIAQAGSNGHKGLRFDREEKEPSRPGRIFPAETVCQVHKGGGIVEIELLVTDGGE